MKKLCCVKCGYLWIPRVENPKLCPGCKQVWTKPHREPKPKQDREATT